MVTLVSQRTDQSWGAVPKIKRWTEHLNVGLGTAVLSWRGEDSPLPWFPKREVRSLRRLWAGPWVTEALSSAVCRLLLLPSPGHGQARGAAKSGHLPPRLRAH